MDDIRAQVAAHGDGAVRVALAGALTPDTADTLRRTFDEVLARGPTAIDLDLAGVVYMASAGVGTLVSLLRRTRERHAPLRLLNLQPDIMNLFRVTRLDKVFAIATETAAVQT